MMMMMILFIVSLFCAWNITTVRSTVAFTYLKVKSAKCLCLLPVVLVLMLVLPFYIFYLRQRARIGH